MYEPEFSPAFASGMCLFQSGSHLNFHIYKSEVVEALIRFEKDRLIK